MTSTPALVFATEEARSDSPALAYASVAPLCEILPIVCAELLASNVLLDFRPGVGLRLAPHFYTRDDEVDQVMGRVRDAIRRAER